MRHTTIRNDQNGLGHVLLIILIVVVLAIIGFAGYTVSQKNKPKASTTATSTTAKSEASAADTGCVATYHDANLCKFASHASLDKVSYSATITSTDLQGTVTSFSFASDGKGNTSLSSGSGTSAFNSVALDGNTYIQTAGVWYEYPASSSTASSAPDPTADMNLVLGAGITYKPLGTSACGSSTCYEYQVSDTSEAGTTQYAWFGTSDYLLHEWKATDTTTGTTDMTITYGTVNITKPSPVQQISQ
ncbi:MAG: hypothetical protein WDN27_04695 [Candidatus Saccharibacteria bacterium]